MSDLKSLEAWQKLAGHYRQACGYSLPELFAADSHRFNHFSIEFGDFLFDYSKNLISRQTMDLLVGLAGECGLKAGIERMFCGEHINITEDRAVLHTALRNFSGNPVIADGIDIMPAVKAVLEQMKQFCYAVHSGNWLGSTGKTITDVVNIGIGGSDLGPAMVCEALRHYSVPNLNVHFVSNVDGTHLHETIKNLNAESTLFIIASKTFTTQETLTNALSARKWVMDKTGCSDAGIASHFVALSTNEEACRKFGIDPRNMFAFWNWVGGRYSLWSAIGLSIALAVGYDNYEELLRGAHAADLHFRTAPMGENIPVIMALLGIWYVDFFGASTHAVIPYDQYLWRFTEFLQQLDMESNGKRVSKTGKTLDYATGPVVWGAAGTNAQHSFFQLIHQGTQLIPVDFIAFANNLNDVGEHQDILLSNYFAQTEALMLGKSEQQALSELKEAGIGDDKAMALLPHKIFPGNKPTNSILIKRLTPFNLGMLIAFYEHKVFTQGLIWQVNSFDQWGVELGKQLAKAILPELSDNQKTDRHDSSTNALINKYKEWKSK